MASSSTKKPKAVEAEAVEIDEGKAHEIEDYYEEYLEGIPELKPFSTFRLRQKNALTVLITRFHHLARGKGKVVTDDDVFGDFMVLCADIDDFAAEIAKDKVAYVDWIESKGDDANQAVLGILMRYMRASGEAKRSTTS